MSPQIQDFTNVDRAADPNYHVNYLDSMTGLEVTQAYKQRSFALLDARSGAHFLDIGCGAGDDARALAQIVGMSGRVVGLDSSETMIEEARKRAVGANLPLEFCVGYTYRLDFADNTFDGCRADRVFQHLDHPQQALTEMVRVVKAGGKIYVFDPDWETLIVDASDHALTRRILNHSCDSHRNGWSGRQLVGQFKASGLKDVALETVPYIFADLTLANPIFLLQQSAERAAEAGIISADESTGWWADLADRAQAGRFFCLAMGLAVSGRKP
ncbi:MAG: methyltransferase domain-containing protein [Chloroflexi bacterium]|nr:methyltransferase domain-containing protein [Chloroflexota bacterium]